MRLPRLLLACSLVLAGACAAPSSEGDTTDPADGTGSAAATGAGASGHARAVSDLVGFIDNAARSAVRETSPAKALRDPIAEKCRAVAAAPAVSASEKAANVSVGRYCSRLQTIFQIYPSGAAPSDPNLLAIRQNMELAATLAVFASFEGFVAGVSAQRAIGP